MPVPLLGATTKFFDLRAKQVLHVDVPNSEMMSQRSQFAAIIPMVRASVMVLSQSCDLEEAERKPNARVIVAPLLADDDDRFAAGYASALEDMSAALTRQLSKGAKKGTPDDETINSAKAAFDTPRRKALEQLWLGDLEGVFPLAAAPTLNLQRSIVYFDNAVSLPATWLPLLRGQRILRMSVTWAHALREKLQVWLGRYAFPGDKNSRLIAGGLISHPNGEASPGEAIPEKRSEASSSE